MPEPKDTRPSEQPKTREAPPSPAPAPPAPPVEQPKAPEPTTVTNKRTGTITATVA